MKSNPQLGSVWQEEVWGYVGIVMQEFGSAKLFQGLNVFGLCAFRKFILREGKWRLGV